MGRIINIKFFLLDYDDALESLKQDVEKLCSNSESSLI